MCMWVCAQFLDAFAGDAAWLGRYAHNREGKAIPWEIIKAHKTATSPYEVCICVCVCACMCVCVCVCVCVSGCVCV